MVTEEDQISEVEDWAGRNAKDQQIQIKIGKSMEEGSLSFNENKMLPSGHIDVNTND